MSLVVRPLRHRSKEQAVGTETTWPTKRQGRLCSPHGQAWAEALAAGAASGGAGVTRPDKHLASWERRLSRGAAGGGVSSLGPRRLRGAPAPLEGEGRGASLGARETACGQACLPEIPAGPSGRPRGAGRRQAASQQAELRPRLLARSDAQHRPGRTRTHAGRARSPPGVECPGPRSRWGRARAEHGKWTPAASGPRRGGGGGALV